MEKCGWQHVYCISINQSTVYYVLQHKCWMRYSTISEMYRVQMDSPVETAASASAFCTHSVASVHVSERQIHIKLRCKILFVTVHNVHSVPCRVLLGYNYGYIYRRYSKMDCDKRRRGRLRHHDSLL